MNNGFQIEIRTRVNDAQYARLYTIDPLEIALLTDPNQVNRTADAVAKQVIERMQSEITRQVVEVIKEHQERLFKYKHKWD